MTTTTVWRVENEKHEGPYNSNWTHAFDIGVAHTGPDHPNGENDGLRWTGNAFGCPSREAAEQWFDGWMDKLIDHGFKLTSYEVPSDTVQVGKSKKQLTFKHPRW